MMLYIWLLTQFCYNWIKQDEVCKNYFVNSAIQMFDVMCFIISKHLSVKGATLRNQLKKQSEVKSPFNESFNYKINL